MVDPEDSRGAHLAAFDFDGTLTRSDSFIRFLSWRRPMHLFAIDLLLTAPLLALYAAGLVGNERHKMALFARQFKGVPAGRFAEIGRDFALHRVPRLLNPRAVACLRKHRDQGHRIVIVTASLADWIEPWAATEGVDVVLASQAEIRGGCLTGRLQGPNCHGPEKVRRLLARFPNRSSYRLHAYGDSRGDEELLAAADKAYYRRFV